MFIVLTDFDDGKEIIININKIIDIKRNILDDRTEVVLWQHEEKQNYYDVIETIEEIKKKLDNHGLLII